MLFIEPISEEILAMTNLYGLQNAKKSWVNITKEELEAYFGLLILAGVFRSHDEELTELWDDTIGRPIFRATMALSRFKVITNCLRFDNRQERMAKQSGERDKLAPVRNVFEKWDKNLSRQYNPGKNVTVDEQLIPFRGRCPFKQYISSKPAKYGIKVWACCEADTAYVWRTQVCTGKPRNGKPETNQGMRVVLEMTEGLKGRRVTADNFFTSNDLVTTLQKRQLTYLGTIRKNKTFLPPKTLDMKKKPPGYSQFVFDNENKISIVSHVPKKNRLVLLISSDHMNKNVSDDESKKPLMILDYNKTKGGVDLADKFVATYTCKRKTNRWPVALFSYMIDTSALNGLIIFSQLFPDWNNDVRHKRRLYLIELGQALINPLILNRNVSPRSSNALRFMQNIRDTNNSPTPPASLGTKPAKKKPIELNPKKKQRCGSCVYNINASRFSIFCHLCDKALCAQHRAAYICDSCVNNAPAG